MPPVLTPQDACTGCVLSNVMMTSVAVTVWCPRVVVEKRTCVCGGNHEVLINLLK